MTRLGKILAALVLTVLTTFAFSSPAFAEPPAFSGNPAAGATVFAANCNACHGGGKNYVNPAKTLSKADLEKWGRYSEEKVIYQITNGGGGMAPFARLGPENIKNLAAYVLTQADKGW